MNKIKITLVGILALAIVLLPNVSQAQEYSLIDILRQQINHASVQISGILQQRSSQLSAASVGTGNSSLTLRTYNNCIFSGETDCSRFVGNVSISLSKNGQTVFSGETNSSGYLKLENLNSGFYTLSSHSNTYEERSGLASRGLFIASGVNQIFNLFFDERDEPLPGPTCPQYSPPAPNWCSEGTVEPGEINDNGCQGPPICVANTPVTPLQITSPNGGETFEVGDTINVTWTPNSPGVVIIDRVDDNGNYISTLFGEKGHGNSVPNTSGSISLNAYSSMLGDNKLKIYEYDSSTYTANNAREGRSDISDGTFTVVETSSSDPSPSVSLSAVPTSGQAPLAVTFTAEAEDIRNCTSSYWNFGDGNVLNVIADCPYGVPTVYSDFVTKENHTYQQEGVYTVTASYGQASDTMTINVTNEPTLNEGGDGDVNGDGTVDVRDVLSVLRHINGLDTIYSDVLHRADVDGNGTVDQRDVVNILRIAVGLPTIDLIMGDVTGDGRVDVSDVIKILRFVQGLEIPTDIQRVVADVDLDGQLTQNDVSQALRISVGLPVEYPEEAGDEGNENAGSGDVNGDGTVDVGDVVLALRVVNGLDSFTTSQTEEADVDGNGVFDMRDVANMLRISVGLPVTQIIIGDVNGDSKVDVSDVVTILRHVNGQINLDAVQKVAADVNLDGVVDQADVQQALRLAVGLPVQY